MKKTLLFSMLTLMLAGCVNQVQPIRLVRFFPVGAGCALPDGDEIVVSGGTLDVAAGAPSYVVGVDFRGEGFERPGLSLRTGEVLEPIGGSRPIITSIVIEYNLSRRIGPTPKPFTQNVVLSAAGGSTELKFLTSLNLISAEMGDILVNGLTPSNAMDDFVDVDVVVTGKGEISDSKTPFSTGSLTFPLRVYRSQPANPNNCTNFLRFPNVDPNSTTGDPDFCGYVGQVYGRIVNTAPQPTACCTGTERGC